MTGYDLKELLETLDKVTPCPDGVEYVKNGWYGMANGSFFSSKYKGGDGKWRHTLFDRNYIINVLGGKEWMLGRNKNNMLSIILLTTDLN